MKLTEDGLPDKFPYNVPMDLTEDEGRQLEVILAKGAPEWVLSLRKELDYANSSQDSTSSN